MSLVAGTRLESLMLSRCEDPEEKICVWTVKVGGGGGSVTKHRDR